MRNSEEGLKENERIQEHERRRKSGRKIERKGRVRVKKKRTSQ